MPEHDLDRRINAALTELCFERDAINADQRVLYDDPQAIERITTDRDGRYVAMGWS